MLKFNIGDVVKIVGNTEGTCCKKIGYPIGTLGVIIQIDENSKTMPYLVTQYDTCDLDILSMLINYWYPEESLEKLTEEE